MLADRVSQIYLLLLVWLTCLATIVAGQNHSRTEDLMPPSQDVAPAILIADSGPKLSGVGKQWSPWYRLEVGKAPKGYTLHRVEFWVDGGRSCGEGAECREILKSDQQIVWEFRLQGHDETGAHSQTYSVAHMRVLYRPEK